MSGTADLSSTTGSSTSRSDMLSRVGKKKRHREEEDTNGGGSMIGGGGTTVGSSLSIDADSRDDRNTSSHFNNDGEETLYDECSTMDTDTDGGMSLGGFSLGSLGRIHNANSFSPSGKRRRGPSRRVGRSQSIHRAMSHALVDDEDNLKLLEFSSTLSEGKMILKNLSINSTYSAEFADLCGQSPANASISQRGLISNTSRDEGGVSTTNDRTPKKRNTRGKWRTSGTAFRIDTASSGGQSLTIPKMTNSNQHDDSPTMFDLMGGDETPTTGLLMNSLMETGLTDDIRSLNGHLRGQSFTPLPMMTVGDRCERTNSAGGHDGTCGGGHSVVGSLGHGGSPQLSWDIRSDGESPLEIHTPRFRLDSSKSSRSYATSGSEPLGSPKGFWKDNIPERKEGITVHHQQGEVKSILSLLSPTMREMNVGCHSGTDLGGPDEATRSTSPLPLYYEDQHGQEIHGGAGSTNDDNSVSVNTTPQRRSPIPYDAQSSPYPPGAQQVPPGYPYPVHMHSSSPWGDYRGGRPPGGGFAGSPLPPHSHHPHHPYGTASAYPDGHPPYHPQGMYNHHHHPPPPPPGYNPNDRVRNLRGNGPPRHQVPPQHHLPPPSYHHFSPLTNVLPGGGRVGRYGGYLLPNHLDMMAGGAAGGGSSSSSSKRKCIPIKPPIPSKFQGDMDMYKDAPIPEFNNLVNFPSHMSNKPCPNVAEGMRCCVMCGQACPCSMGGGKSTKKVGSYIGGSSSSSMEGRSSSSSSSSAEDGRVTSSFSGGGGGSVAPLGDSAIGNNNKGVSSSSSFSSSSLSSAPPPPPLPHHHHPPPPHQHHHHHHIPSNMISAVANAYANIPTQNKGLCTICDVNVWIVTSSGLEIKWCKGCKNFRPWAAFGDKGLATKCVRCRERQREKYALQKEEKDKKKVTTTTTATTCVLSSKGRSPPPTPSENNIISIQQHHPHHSHEHPQQVRQAASNSGNMSQMSCDVAMSSSSCDTPYSWMGMN